MSKIKVTGLELETKKGKKVSLSLEEAKELHEQLDELFGKETQYIPYYTGNWPYWYNSARPIWGSSGYSHTVGVAANTVTSDSTGMKLTYLSDENRLDFSPQN